MSYMGFNLWSLDLGGDLAMFRLMRPTAKGLSRPLGWAAMAACSGGAAAFCQVSLSGLQAHQGGLYWIEQRPLEQGRNVLMYRSPSGELQELNPAPSNCRTRVHEYGGAAACSEFKGQQLQRCDSQSTVPMTAESGGFRFADGRYDIARKRLVLVRETENEAPSQIVNQIVSLSEADANEQVVVATGSDFYAHPRLSPNGEYLCYVSWDHPNMPWDNTSLHVQLLDQTGNAEGAARLVSAVVEESVCQPLWSPDGKLLYLSDSATGFYNLHCFDPSTQQATAICTFSEGGVSQLVTIDIESGELSKLQIEGLPTAISSIAVVSPTEVAITGGGPQQPTTVVLVDLSKASVEQIRSSCSVPVPSEYFAVPEPIEFPTDGDETAHAFYYKPTNPQFTAPSGQRPPLLVKLHGGPTAGTSTTFRMDIAYWTSRGFAVLDVDYGGSQGYGRAYRQRLAGEWGVVDVADCCNGAKHIAELGWADPEKLCIDGGSAGGFTVLAALAFKDVFKAGCAKYGISDLTALAQETHKFESRYLDRLVGPYPEYEDVYKQRSPINSVSTFNAPILVQQGDEDKIVPPNQSEMIFDAVKSKGIPCAYQLFSGEQHGFRKPETIKTAIETELYFYSKVFGFTCADVVEPIKIVNMD